MSRHHLRILLIALWLVSVPALVWGVITVDFGIIIPVAIAMHVCRYFTLVKFADE